jgi:hypothetical protein
MFYMIAPKAFRAHSPQAEYRELNGPVTEMWRACQKSSTAGDGHERFSLLSDVESSERCTLLMRRIKI